MINLLFSGHDFKFLTPFIDYCRENPRLSVRLDKHRGHVVDSETTAEECCRWADIIFCEWAMGNLVWYSRHKRPGQLLIARLHSQEIESCRHFLDETDWEKVDRLILICPRNLDWMREHFPKYQDRFVLIYNPIDAAERFSLPRMEGADFNLGFLGIVPLRKRLDLAFDIFEKLKAGDSRYTLSIKGAKPQEYPWMSNRREEMKWYNDLFARIDASPYRNSVLFEPHGPDIAEWYSHIGFILSTSDFEGSHQAVAEGMASGCIPVIRNWPGAAQLYPERYVYDYDAPADEACRMILNWKRTPQGYLDELESCRKYAMENFDQRKVCRELEALLKLHPGYEVRPVEKALSLMLIGYIPAGAKDGYRIRIEQLLRHLTAAGASVTLACLHPAAPVRDLAEHKASLEQTGARVRLVECLNFFDLSLDSVRAAETLDALEKIIREEGVDVVQGEALYASRYIAMLKERNPDLPVVFDCHGASPEEEAMSQASPARIRTSEAWEEQILESADLQLFVADAMNRHFRNKYGRDLEYLVVPCCIREEACRESRVPASKFGLPADRPIAGYVGTLATWQCVAEMFELFRELHRRDSELFFAMLVPERDHKECFRRFQEAGIPKESYLVRQLPHEQVADALPHFDAGILLRRDSVVNRVSSPTKFGEYVAAGVPVVLTDCIGDYSRLAAEYGLGLVLPASPEKEWTFSDDRLDAILRMMRDHRSLRGEYVRRGIDFVREHIFWNSHISRMMSAYDKLRKLRGKNADCSCS